MSRVTLPSGMGRQLAAAAAVGTFALGLVGIAGIAGITSPGTGRPIGWFLLAGGGWLLVVGLAWRNRSDNCLPGDGRRFDRLGPANAVTLVRGWLLAALAGFLAVDPAYAWLPAALFVAAGLLDAVDGAVARRTRETVLGARLDTSTDALAVLVGGAVGVVLSVLPVWYLLAGVVWYAFVGGLRLRRWANKPVYGLPDSRIRPLIGSLQLVVIGGALLPAFGPPETTAAAAIALSLLCASFARDWAAATGRLGRFPEGRRRATEDGPSEGD